MLRLLTFLLLVAVVCLASSSFKRVARLSDPLAYGGLGWELQELQVEDYVKGSVWPKPQGETPSGAVYKLAPGNFQFSITGESSDVLQEAVKRYKVLTFPDNVSESKKNFSQITKLTVDVLKDYENLTLDSDESYKLEVKAPTSSLTAATVWGALRGLETFSQIVHQDPDGFYFANGTQIVDYPRFHHRGFMIDTSRHYLNLSVIFKFMDAMSYGKFNVLHWHVVDDQSFPFSSKTFPQLSGMGAFNNQTHIYTEDDVSKILEYARMRGIRVVPEFDTPGHTFSWRSIPDLLTPCYKEGKPSGSYGPINPIVEANYNFLNKFFQEVAERFPDKYVHLGGDEVPFGCWQSNPEITEWMTKMGYGKNYYLLEQYYEQKLLKIVGSLEKDYIVWQEVIDNNVQVLPNTVVNVWKSSPSWPSEMAKVTGKGLKAILSSCWYLNYISYGIDWHKYYQCDPQNFKGTEAQMELVMGGTGCMWGEFVDGTNILPRTWPRALAIAERLWSSKLVTDLTDADNRLWEHRCRYLRRGIPAEPGVEAKYCRHEWNV
ncbi:beta-hexosaminidase subunit beta-like [Stylophora pistillata]|uniref:beta-hexosaminidase subunit beta-like n=1 Tax=Stylophora pistillata TaxID=50429 RepID=UPI000C053F9E|nr:beta-hexosaminidase subunit beta-like [Stylophora pistillata]